MIYNEYNVNVSCLFSYELINIYVLYWKKMRKYAKKYNIFIDLFFEIGYNSIVNSLEILLWLLKEIYI